MADRTKGYFCLVLHAHLPYVRHPEYEDSLEEHWFYEAVAETYIPIVAILEQLVEEGVQFRLTMSVSPPLASMLRDDLLQRRCLRYLERLVELGEKEVVRTHRMPEFHPTAQMYLRKAREALGLFRDRHRCDLLQAFQNLQDAGVLEITTCGATHGFLPLMQDSPNAVRAQIAVGCQSYAEHFRCQPRGMWNAECGYYPGLDRFLREQGVRYFIVDTHGILYADRRPIHGVFAPVYCRSGVAAFGRDLESSKSVWSAEEGYPGDFRYREYYRDIGYDLPLDYIGSYIHESGLRIGTGFKYHRITGRSCDLADKQPYDPTAALAVADAHAGNFMFNRERQVEYLSGLMDRPPVIVAPYDAELFGHWWYEGPEFLRSLLRRIHHDSKVLGMITPSEYLERYPRNQLATPSLSSWGFRGYCEVWLEETNDWIYRHLHKAAERMIALANKNRRETDPIRVRMLNQAARELLLAQSSDWAFIMKTRTMVEYAVKRTKEHLLNFRDLWRMLEDHTSNPLYLAGLEGKNNIFPNISYLVYTDPA